MDSRLKQRLVGAAVLVAAAVVFVPMIFGPGEDEPPVEGAASIPAYGSREGSRVIAAPLPLPEPAPSPVAEPFAGNVAPAEVATAEPARPGTTTPGRGDTPVAGHAGTYAVQLASFSDARNATALERRLADKGYAAFSWKGEGGSQAVTRVYVGPLSNPAEAKDMIERLRRETKLEGLVVRYPKP